MKNILLSSLVAFCAILSGCDDDLPSEEKIGNLSRAVGYAAGKTCDLAKMSDKAYDITLQVMDTVQTIVPGEGQSFTDAWTPEVKKIIAKYIESGDINESEGKLISDAVGVATMGIDYIFDVRWPKAKEYKNLVSVAVYGFIEGFKAVKPVSVVSATKFDYDETEFKAAMEYFNKNK